MPVLEKEETRIAGRHAITLESMSVDAGRFEETGTHPILLPYQERAVNRVAGSTSAIIATSTALNKRRMAVEVARRALERGLERVIVLTAAALVDYWVEEITVRFGVESADVLRVQGDECVRDVAYFGSKAHWVVLSYDLLIRDAPMLQRLAANACLVVDNADEVVNPKCKRGAATRTVAKLAEARLGLLGPADRYYFPDWHSLVELILDPKRENRNNVKDAALAACSAAGHMYSVLTMHPSCNVLQELH